MENEKEGMGSGKRMLIVAGVAGVILGYLLGTSAQGKAGESAGGGSEVMPLTMVNHLQAELPEQDVFLEVESGSDRVMRVDLVDAESDENLQKPVFATAAEHEHDPFKLGEAPLGPFDKGEELGFTLGDWLAGEATGTYEVEGGTATLRIAGTNLVPDGVYTVWCSRLKMPPEPAVIDIPCGAIDGSENSFTTDAAGSVSHEISMMPLEPSTETVINVIALAYHSGGETYGTLPGEFGSDTHVQLFYMMPAPETK